MKQASIGTLRDSFDLDRVIRENDIIQQSFRHTIQSTKLKDQQQDQFSDVQDNPNFMSYQDNGDADCDILIKKMHKKVFSKTTKNRRVQDAHTFGTAKIGSQKSNDQSSKTRLFCEGDKLKSSLIDIDKSFGFIEEIQSRQDRKNQDQETIQNPRSPKSRSSGNAKSSKKLLLLQKSSPGKKKLNLNLTQKLTDQDTKWNKVIRFMKKNPKVLLNVIPTPKREPPERKEHSGKIVNLITINEKNKNIHPRMVTYNIDDDANGGSIQYIQKVQWFSKGRPQSCLRVRSPEFKQSQKDIYYQHKRIISNYYKDERHKEKRAAIEEQRFMARKQSSQSKTKSTKSKILVKSTSKSNYRGSTAATFETNPAIRVIDSRLKQRQSGEIPNYNQSKKKLKLQASKEKQMHRINQSQIQQSMSQVESNFQNSTNISQERPKTSHAQNRRIKKLVDAANKLNSTSQPFSTGMTDLSNVESVLKNFNDQMFGVQPRNGIEASNTDGQSRFREQRFNQTQLGKKSGLKLERDDFSQMKYRLRQMLATEKSKTYVGHPLNLETELSNQIANLEQQDQKHNHEMQQTGVGLYKSQQNFVNQNQLSQNDSSNQNHNLNINQDSSIMKIEEFQYQKLNDEELILDKIKSESIIPDNQIRMMPKENSMMIKSQEMTTNRRKLQQRQKSKEKSGEINISSRNTFDPQQSPKKSDHAKTIQKQSPKQRMQDDVRIRNKIRVRLSGDKKIYKRAVPKDKNATPEKSMKYLIKTIQSDDLKRIIEENERVQEQQQEQLRISQQLAIDQQKLMISPSLKKLGSDNRSLHFSNQIDERSPPPVVRLFPYRDLKDSKLFKQVLSEKNEKSAKNSHQSSNKLLKSQDKKKKVEDPYKLAIDELDYTLEQMKKNPRDFSHHQEELQEIYIKAMDILEVSMKNMGMKKIFAKIKDQFCNSADFRTTFKLVIRQKMMRETEQQLKYIFKSYLEFVEYESIIEQLRDDRAERDLVVYQIDKLFDIYESLMPLIIQFLKVNKIFQGVIVIHNRDLELFLKEVISRYSRS